MYRLHKDFLYFFYEHVKYMLPGCREYCLQLVSLTQLPCNCSQYIRFMESIFITSIKVDTETDGVFILF